MTPAGLPMPSTPSATPAASAPNAAARSAQASDRDSKRFAGMLDEATPTDAPVPADAAPASTDTETKAESADDKVTDDDALPGQLLALLGGQWATTPATPAAQGHTASANALLAGTSASANANALPGLPGSVLSPSTTGANVMAEATATATGNTGFALPALLTPSATSARPDAAALAALSGFQPGIEARADSVGDALTSAGRETGVDGLTFTLPTAPAAPALTPRAVAMLDTVMLPPDPDAGFGDDLGMRVGWMVDQKLGEAQIRVHPEHVGPIDVRVQLDGQRVSAEFNSANADVRQALEAGLGRLRDMLSQQGLQLAHAGVGDGQREGQGNGQGPADSTATGTTAEDAPRLRASRGLLDEYA